MLGRRSLYLASLKPFMNRHGSTPRTLGFAKQTTLQNLATRINAGVFCRLTHGTMALIHTSEALWALRDSWTATRRPAKEGVRYSLADPVLLHFSVRFEELQREGAAKHVFRSRRQTPRRHRARG